MVVYSRSLKDTEQIALYLVSRLKKGSNLCLNGPLGSGKTQFTRYLLKAMGVQEVFSPSYTLVNCYEIPPTSPFFDRFRGYCYHSDLYRLGHEEALEETLIEEYLESPSLCVVEWADRFPLFFKSFEHLEIMIEILGQERAFHIKSHYPPG